MDRDIKSFLYGYQNYLMERFLEKGMKTENLFHCRLTSEQKSV